MKNPLKDISILINEDNTSLLQFTPYLEFYIKKFEKDRFNSIKNYDNWILNSKKSEYLKNPDYTLHEVKNRDSANSIVAKAKWVYDVKGVQRKSKTISIFIASTAKFPEGLSDKGLLHTAPLIIKEYLSRVSPQFEIDLLDLAQNKLDIEVYYYIKNKLPEIHARLEPNFYLSKSTNKNNFERIIANVKWGFPNRKTAKPKRYITLYLGNNKADYKDLKDENVKNEFKSKVSELLFKQIPFDFTIPF